ncbi:hypothetical protein [Crossiella sp. CA198]|uniref:hypothetical protein n=1 Tax=Crossiella sp. CA198 TaxID=3455607 RepID=UPI003F8D0234
MAGVTEETGQPLRPVDPGLPPAVGRPDLPRTGGGFTDHLDPLLFLGDPVTVHLDLGRIGSGVRAVLVQGQADGARPVRILLGHQHVQGAAVEQAPAGAGLLVEQFGEGPVPDRRGLVGGGRGPVRAQAECGGQSEPRPVA